MFPMDLILLSSVVKLLTLYCFVNAINVRISRLREFCELWLKRGAIWAHYYVYPNVRFLKIQLIFLENNVAYSRMLYIVLLINFHHQMV